MEPGGKGDTTAQPPRARRPRASVDQPQSDVPRCQQPHRDGTQPAAGSQEQGHRPPAGVAEGSERLRPAEGAEVGQPVHRRPAVGDTAQPVGDTQGQPGGGQRRPPGLEDLRGDRGHPGEHQTGAGQGSAEGQRRADRLALGNAADRTDQADCEGGRPGQRQCDRQQCAPAQHPRGQQFGPARLLFGAGPPDDGGRGQVSDCRRAVHPDPPGGDAADGGRPQRADQREKRRVRHNRRGQPRPRGGIGIQRGDGAQRRQHDHHRPDAPDRDRQPFPPNGQPGHDRPPGQRRRGCAVPATRGGAHGEPAAPPVDGAPTQ